MLIIRKVSYRKYYIAVGIIKGIIPGYCNDMMGLDHLVLRPSMVPVYICRGLASKVCLKFHAEI